MQVEIHAVPVARPVVVKANPRSRWKLVLAHIAALVRVLCSVKRRLPSVSERGVTRGLGLARHGPSRTGGRFRARILRAAVLLVRLSPGRPPKGACGVVLSLEHQISIPMVGPTRVSEIDITNNPTPPIRAPSEGGSVSEF
jgi:hypothetical protein